MTPEERSRYYAVERVIYTAVKLSEAATIVQGHSKAMEERVRAAIENGVLPGELKSVTQDLEEFGVTAMIDRAYREYLAGKFEVAGRDTVMYCVAHRRRLAWMPAPGWWIHADKEEGRPLDLLDGHQGDPRGCASMWNAPAPIEITRKKAS